MIREVIEQAILDHQRRLEEGLVKRKERSGNEIEEAFEVIRKEMPPFLSDLLPHTHFGGRWKTKDTISGTRRKFVRFRTTHPELKPFDFVVETEVSLSVTDAYVSVYPRLPVTWYRREPEEGPLLGWEDELLVWLDMNVVKNRHKTCMNPT